MFPLEALLRVLVPPDGHTNNDPALSDRVFLKGTSPGNPGHYRIPRQDVDIPEHVESSSTLAAIQAATNPLLPDALLNAAPIFMPIFNARTRKDTHAGTEVVVFPSQLA